MLSALPAPAALASKTPQTAPVYEKKKEVHSEIEDFIEALNNKNIEIYAKDEDYAHLLIEEHFDKQIFDDIAKSTKKQILIENIFY